LALTFQGLEVSRFLATLGGSAHVLEATLEARQPHRWMEIAVGGYGATVEILDSKMPTADTVQHLFDVQVNPDLMDDVVRAMRRDKDLTGLEIIRSKNGHVYGSAASARCTLCKEVAKSKCFISSVSVISKDMAHWTVLGNDDSFRALSRSLRRRGIPFRVTMQKRLEDTDLLTTRQEQILSIAFEKGYFDFPKKVGLKELAAETGIKAATLAEILRRGQKKILGEYLTRRLLLHRGVPSD
jgi:predicted DNA binding protein